MPLKSIVRIVIIVLLILLIPLALTIRDGNVPNVGWNWSPGDFLVMGTLLFITGVAIDYAVRTFKTPAKRTIAVLAIIFGLLVVWAELAVGALEQFVIFLLG